MELREILDPALLTEIRRIELRTKRTISADMMGQYRSAFRGTGLIFSDLREYEPGDDVKNIHWKATARSGKVYVKSYEEDRQLNIIVALDVSSSTNFGAKRSKHRAALEFAALVSLLAKANQDAIGLCTFSGQVEEFLPPRRARSQLHRILKKLLDPRELTPSTNVAKALKYLKENQKRSSVIFVVSDFISPPFQQELTTLTLKHDVIMVMLQDQLDYSLPTAGLVEFEDAESGARIVIDTSNGSAKKQLEDMHRARIDAWKEQCTSAGADHLVIKDNSLRPLMQLMNERAGRLR